MKIYVGVSFVKNSTLHLLPSSTTVLPTLFFFIFVLIFYWEIIVGSLMPWNIDTSQPTTTVTSVSTPLLDGESISNARFYTSPLRPFSTSIRQDFPANTSWQTPYQRDQEYRHTIKDLNPVRNDNPLHVWHMQYPNERVVYPMNSKLYDNWSLRYHENVPARIWGTQHRGKHYQVMHSPNQWTGNTRVNFTLGE